MTNQEAIQIERTKSQMIARRSILTKVANTFTSVRENDVEPLFVQAELSSDVTYHTVKAEIDSITKQLNALPKISMKQYLAIKSMI